MSTVNLSPLDGCGSAVMEAHIAARAADPLRLLRIVEAAGPDPVSHAHYSAYLAAAIRAALAGFAAGADVVTIGDGVYQIAVTIAGRRHLVTVQPEQMRALS